MAGGGVQVAMAEAFIPSVNALESMEGRRVLKAFEKFTRDPAHPSLNLHPVQTDNAGRIHTFRASDELRVIACRLDDGSWVVHEAGHHDEIYLRASLGKFVAGADGSCIGFFVPGDEPGESTEAREKSKGEHIPDDVLRHWTDRELQEVGYSLEDIAEIRACTTASQLLDLMIDEEQIMLAIDLIEVTPESYRERLAAGEPPRATGGEMVAAVAEDGGAWGLSQFLGADEVERLLSAPIEKWMLFLHPRQRALVDRSYEGPARIGGPAGTGKTSVALHRAAALANRFRADDPNATVLFTTFINSLPPVFESLYQQLPQRDSGCCGVRERERLGCPDLP